MNRRWTILFVVLALTMAAQAQHHRRYSSGYGAAIPQGTQVQIRMIDALSSASAKPGQSFRATLEQPIVVNGQTLYPRGADVEGQVLQAKSSGRLSAPGELELALTSVGGNPITTVPLMMKGQSHTKSNVTKIGGGAAAGAVLGALLGGGKGAAVGAGVGAAAGTGVAAATGKKDTTIESEAVLAFVSAEPPAGQAQNPRYGSGTAQQGSRYGSGNAQNGTRYGDRSAQTYDDPRGRRYGSSPEFSEADRNTIRSCMSGEYGGLPPGLAKRDRLPPGLERQVQRNGQLPPGLQKRVQPLPGVCTARLPQLPVDWARVILGGHVLLLDNAQRIKDMFDLNQ